MRLTAGLVIPAPYRVGDKLRPESSNPNASGPPVLLGMTSKTLFRHLLRVRSWVSEDVGFYMLSEYISEHIGHFSDGCVGFAAVHQEWHNVFLFRGRLFKIL